MALSAGYIANDGIAESKFMALLNIASSYQIIPKTVYFPFKKEH